MGIISITATADTDCVAVAPKCFPRRGYNCRIYILLFMQKTHYSWYRFSFFIRPWLSRRVRYCVGLKSAVRWWNSTQEHWQPDCGGGGQFVLYVHAQHRQPVATHWSPHASHSWCVQSSRHERALLQQCACPRTRVSSLRFLFGGKQNTRWTYVAPTCRNCRKAGVNWYRTKRPALGSQCFLPPAKERKETEKRKKESKKPVWNQTSPSHYDT